MYPQYMFEQKYENSQKISTENCHFYSREKSLYIVWACFHNDVSDYILTNQKNLMRLLIQVGFRMKLIDSIWR